MNKAVKKILSILLAAMILWAISVPALAGSLPTVSTKVKDNQLEITVKDDNSNRFTEVFTFTKNTTNTYTVGEYVVEVVTNNNDVKRATIISHGLPQPNDHSPTPKIGVDGMTWTRIDAEVASDNFIQTAQKKNTEIPETALIPVASDRENSSGEKITSNAHSGDFPGIYFYWDDKQKMDGFLKVDPAVFTWFDEDWFFITAKNSNAYWDYIINEDEGFAYVDVDGKTYLMYQIPRFFMVQDKDEKTGEWVYDDNTNLPIWVKDELKDINMIFLDGLWRVFELVIEKEWLDNEGDPTAKPSYANATFTNGYSLGRQVVKLLDRESVAIYFSENDIPRHKFIKVSINGEVSYVNEVDIVVGSGDSYYIVFTNENTDADITIEKVWGGFWSDLPTNVQTNLRNSLSFSNSLRLGLNKVAPGTVNIRENLPNNWSWYTSDGFTKYTVKFAKVTVYDENGEIVSTSDTNLASLTAEEYSKFTVVFINEIEKDDVRGTLEVKKNWSGAYLDLPEDVFEALQNSLVFGGYSLNTPVEVGSGKSISFQETLPANWSYTSGGWRYTVRFVNVRVNSGSASTNNRVNFTTADKGNYIIVFTNEILKADITSALTITKTWSDRGGFSQDILNAMLNFGDYELGANARVAPGTRVEFSEGLPAPWLSADGKTRYTIQFVSVRVNNGSASSTNNVSFTAADGTSYTVAFTNRVVSDNISANYKVQKTWEGSLAGFTAAQLNARLTFGGNTLGQTYNVSPGTQIKFSEGGVDTSWFSADGLTKYTIEYVSVQINNGTISETNEVDIIAAEKGNYTITFKNRLKVEDVSAKYKVVKEWEGNLAALGFTAAELNTRLSFGGNVLGQEYSVVPGTRISFSELASNGSALPYSWLSADGETRYTIRFISVKINDGEASGVNAVDIDAAEKGNYTITFKNEIIANDITSKLEISKEWEGNLGSYTKDELNAKLTFGGYALGQAYDKAPGARINFSEGLPATWESSDGKTRYTIEFAGVAVNGDASDENEVDFTVMEGVDYAVVFINRLIIEDISGALNVTKVWQSTGNKTEAQLNTMITYNPVLGPQSNLAPGTVFGNIGETINNASWLSTNGETRYTIEKVSVSVDGSNTATSLTIAEKGNHSIIFTNRVKEEDVRATLNVSKEWVGDVSGFTADFLNRKISFTPVLGSGQKVVAGNAINLSEDVATGEVWTWLSTDGKTRYTIERVGIKLNGNDATSFTPDEKGTYNIVFTNRLKAEDAQATLNVSKVWSSAAGLDTDFLNGKIIFAPVLGNGQKVVAGNAINLSETPIANGAWTWLSTDRKTRYTIVQGSIKVNGADATSFTPEEMSTYNIVFTNSVTAEDAQARLNVSKTWSDTAGFTDEFLNGKITFTPGLGNSLKVLADDEISISEVPSAGSVWTWLSEDGKTRYTIEQVSIEVDGEEKTSLTPEEGGEYNIAFTNRVKVDDVQATLNVSKEWTEAAGFDIPFLNGKTTFSPVLGNGQKVVAGRVINISEGAVTNGDWTWLSEDGKTRYTIEQVSIKVDGKEATSLTPEEKGAYAIVFTNKVKVEDVQARLNVSKSWTGDIEDFDDAFLNGKVSFTPGLGDNLKFVAGQPINLSEGPSFEGAWTWLSADSKTRYTIEQVSIKVDGIDKTSFTPGEKGTYNIVFTNSVTAEDVQATLNVSKTWTGDIEDFDDEFLNGKVSFVPGLGNGLKFVAGEEINISEAPSATGAWTWLSGDGKTRYTIVQGSIKVDGIEKTSFTPEEKETYNIVFTNTVISEDVQATLNVSKTWSDAAGFTDEFLNAKITFAPLLGANRKFVAGAAINLSEVPSSDDAWVWFDSDGKTRYTIVQDGITVNGDSMTSFTPGEKGSYDIVFTNKVTLEDISATITVNKQWNSLYNELPEQEKTVLMSGLTFGDYQLGIPDTVAPGTGIDFSEGLPDWSWTSADGLWEYTVEFKSVTVTGTANEGTGNSVILTAEEKGNYVITFVNEIVKKKNPTLTISKNWTAIQVDPDSGAVTPYNYNNLSAEVRNFFVSQLAFTNGYSLMSNQLITVGSLIQFAEEDFEHDSFTTSSTLDKNIYYVVRGIITVNGVEVDEVDFEAMADTDYTVVFTNVIEMRQEKFQIDVGMLYKGHEAYPGTPKNAQGHATNASVKDHWKSSDSTLYLAFRYVDAKGELIDQVKLGPELNYYDKDNNLIDSYTSIPSNTTDLNKMYDYGIGYINGTFWINNLDKESTVRIEGEHGYFIVTIDLGSRDGDTGSFYNKLSVTGITVHSYTPY